VRFNSQLQPICSVDIGFSQFGNLPPFGSSAQTVAMSACANQTDGFQLPNQLSRQVFRAPRCKMVFYGCFTE